jgi:hypothetical protein
VREAASPKQSHLNLAATPESDPINFPIHIWSRTEPQLPFFISTTTLQQASLRQTLLRLPSVCLSLVYSSTGATVQLPACRCASRCRDFISIALLKIECIVSRHSHHDPHSQCRASSRGLRAEMAHRRSRRAHSMLQSTPLPRNRGGRMHGRARRSILRRYKSFSEAAQSN